MKVTISILLLGAIGRLVTFVIVGQVGMLETILGKLLVEIPVVTAFIVLVIIGLRYSNKQTELFMEHLKSAREDFKGVSSQTREVQERQIAATSANIKACEGIQHTLAENTKAFDRLDRTLSRQD